MQLSPDALRAALAEVPHVEGDLVARGKPLATQLCAFVERNRGESDIDEVYSWAYNVEFVLKDGNYWAIECLSPDAFRMYPGFVRGDTVVWANIWVRGSDLTLDELVQQINEIAFGATKETIGNA